MTFASANHGARNYPRVRRTLWLCLGTVFVTGLGLGLIFLTLGAQLLKHL